MNVAIYTRAHPAHAWKFESTSSVEFAKLAVEVNAEFGVETLRVPLTGIGDALPKFLDSYQSQADFAEESLR